MLSLKIASIKNIVLSSAVVFCLMIAMLVWTVASPVGSSPDEDFHQTMLYCAAGKTEQCYVNGTRYGHCYSMRPAVAGDCNNYKELTKPKATFVDYEKTMPLYYKTMSVLVGETLGQTTLRIRVANVIIAIIMAVLSVTLTCNKYKKAIGYALIVSSVPSGLFFISSINPSAWAIIFVATSIGPIFSLSNSFFNENIIRKKENKNNINIIRIAFIILTITFGVGSRFEVMMWFPMVAILAVLMSVTNKKRLELNVKELIVFGALIIVSIFATAVAFYGKFHSDISSALPLITKNYLTWRIIEKTLNSLLGMLALSAVPGAELGTHDVPMPAVVSFFASLAIGTSVIYGLSRFKFTQVVIFIFLLIITWLIVSILWSLASWDVYQPRYFSPLLYLIVFVSLSEVDELEFFKQKWIWMQVLFCVFIVYSVALLSTELRFIFGLMFQKTRYPLGKEAPDINLIRLYDSQLPQWWLIDVDWLNPFASWLTGIVFFAVGLSLLWCKTCKISNDVN